MVRYFWIHENKYLHQERDYKSYTRKTVTQAGIYVPNYN